MGSRKIGQYIRINSSRSGISASVGVSGMRVSIGSKGIRTHMTVPGTGYTKTNTLLSFRKLLKKKKKGKVESGRGESGKVKGEKTGALETDLIAGPIQDELVLSLEPRKPGSRFSDQGKADRVVNKGIDAFNEEDIEEAIARFEEALTISPEDKEVAMYLAVIYYLHLEDYEKALDYFDQLEEDMYNEDMKLAIADCLFELEDYDYTKTVLESFKFDDDEDMERMTLLARCHIQEGNLVLAEELLKSAMGRKRKLTPYLMEAKYAMGELCLLKKDYEGAKKYLMPIYMEDSSYEDIGRLVEELALSGDEA